MEKRLLHAAPFLLPLLLPGRVLLKASSPRTHSCNPRTRRKEPMPKHLTYRFFTARGVLRLPKPTHLHLRSPQQNVTQRRRASGMKNIIDGIGNPPVSPGFSCLAFNCPESLMVRLLMNDFPSPSIFYICFLSAERSNRNLSGCQS